MTFRISSMPVRRLRAAPPQPDGDGRPGPGPGNLRRHWLLLLAASAGCGLAVAAPGAPAPTERALLPLFRETETGFSGGAPKEFRILLPRAVAPVTGSELRVTLRPAREPVAEVAISVLWNKRELLTTNVAQHADALVSIRVPVEPSWLRAANTISLQPVSLNPNTTPPGALARAGWSLRRTECQFEFAFARLPFVPELDRFPHTLTEARLLAPAAASARTKPPPVLAVLLPGVSGAAHLRAAVIVAARVGQLDYVTPSDWRLSPLELWKLEVQVRNVVVIARRDQLGGIDLPPPIQSALTALRAGQGLLAEFFPGPPPNQHRVVLVSGADDSGLETSALTLGSAPALAALPGSPAVISEKPALVVVAAEASAPPTFDGLYQIQEILLADRFARQAAYVVPTGCSLSQARVLFALGAELGRRLPGAPVLWPEVVTYQRGLPPAPERLQDRNVLALGAVADWPFVLPPGAKKPALRIQAPDAATVTIQGRRQRRSELEPTLAFAQLLPSPWSATNVLVLVGGWERWDIPATEQLLLAPATPSKLAGNLAAMDALGRAAAYELRHVASESFAERLRRMIPPGVGAEETSRRVAAHELRQGSALRWNGILARVCGCVLLLLVAARLLFMAQQAHLRQRAFAAERGQGGGA